MDIEIKHKILNQLSQTPSEKALTAIKKEFEKTKSTLEIETSYPALQEALAQLSIYAFRVPTESVEAISDLIERLDKAPFLALGNAHHYLDAKQALGRLTKDAVAILERIRYLDIPRTLETLVKVSTSEDESIRIRAREALRSCAKYDSNIVFSDENRIGLGYGPQLAITEFLETQSNHVSDATLDSLLLLSAELLSPTIEGTSFDYKTVTWSSGAVSVTDALRSIRTRTLAFIFDRYKLDLSETVRRQLISAAFVATELPRDDYTSEILDMVEANTLQLFDWVKTIIAIETYPVLQKLEHDVYWRFYRGATEATKASALEVRDLLEADAEYQIYRNLIGFESIFENWEDSLIQQRDFEEIEIQRKQKAKEYISAITFDNWNDWRNRILKFCETRSNDSATFPLFYEFLYEFSLSHPTFALELVRDNKKEIELFKIPVFRGLLNGPFSEDFKSLALEQAQNSEDLSALTKMFFGTGAIDTDILDAIVKSAIQSHDEFALAELVSLAAKSYSVNPKFAVENLLVPAIDALNSSGNTTWVQLVWFQREMRTLIANLEIDELSLFLKALETTKTISFQVEELLTVVAERHPDLVIDLFGRRIELLNCSCSIEPIPHSFDSLKGPLSDHPDMIVKKVKGWAQHDSWQFEFHGGRLIAIAFPELSEDLETALMPLARSSEPSDAIFVLGVLRNYHGKRFIHALCRRLILTHFENEQLISEVSIVLKSSGVVVGEFGMAEAYAQKAEELKYWLSDSEAIVREFAKNYIEALSHQEKQERLRAEESIELRKHKFGVLDINSE